MAKWKRVLQPIGVLEIVADDSGRCLVGGVSWEVPYSLNKPEEYFCAELIILASLLSQSC